MSASTAKPRYKLIFTVPHSSLAACKNAVFSTGAGTYPSGKYFRACFETPGINQFTPSAGARPHIGQAGKMEKIEEMKVEVLCVGHNVMSNAVRSLKYVHPYEEVPYEVYKLEDV